MKYIIIYVIISSKGFRLRSYVCDSDDIFRSEVTIIVVILTTLSVYIIGTSDARTDIYNVF